MSTPVFFEKEFAWNNNWGRPVGIETEGVLVLNRKSEQDPWELTPTSAFEICGVRVRQYRSIYLLVLGAVAAIVALFIAYIGLTGEAVGPGIFTIPLMLSFFVYFVFKGSKRICIEFDGIAKRLVYRSRPSCLNETKAALPKLLEWANVHHIALEMDTSLAITG